MSAITVVITTHNLEAHIDRCLGELFGQTMRDFDVLLVDDASTDNTAALVEQWRERFGGRLRTLCLEENVGCAAARNQALTALADGGGEYVLFLDGDDSMEPHMLEALYARARSPETGARADVVICAYDRVDAATGRVFATEMRGFPPEMAWPPTDDTPAFINPAPWNKLWRRDLIRDLRFPALRIGEEIVFNFRAFARARQVAFVDEALIHYRVRPDSAIARVTEGEIRGLARELLQCRDAQTGPHRDLAGMAAFLHIGLSMALRAADNPEIDLGKHLADTAAHFREQYDWFRGNRLLKLAALRKRKLKGFLIWLALLAYRSGCFAPALTCYRALGLHIKF